MPGLVGFPGAGIQGEKARPMKIVGICLLYSCFISEPTFYILMFLSGFRGTKGLLGLLVPEDLLDWV